MFQKQMLLLIKTPKTLKTLPNFLRNGLTRVFGSKELLKNGLAAEPKYGGGSSACGALHLLGFNADWVGKHKRAIAESERSRMLLCFLLVFNVFVHVIN